ncbi:MAG: DUF3991 domain-containing protein [Oscillospiraceae bacterium]|jgi:hypothetical protein|nr:DUF3991 domain-containing protein [Oscillospiraceae bacterium]
MSYIAFTEEEKRWASQVDLAEFLRSRGEELLRSGREYRLANDHSVTVRGNRWYDHAADRGGGPVSFLQTFCGLSYPEAVSCLLGSGILHIPAPAQREEPKREFALPPANGNMRRVYAYLLKRRCLDREVVSAFARMGLLYESREIFGGREYHNAVFVGKDENGVPRHAHKRSVSDLGKPFRLNVEGSDPRYAFQYIGTSDRFYVFEAPIDLLSFLSLHPEGWEEHSYLACCGTSSQPLIYLLDRLPELRQVFLCLDNDQAGHAACRRMAEQLSGRALVDRLIPEGKDWNDDLVSLHTQEEQEVHGFCQTFGS